MVHLNFELFVFWQNKGKLLHKFFFLQKQTYPFVLMTSKIKTNKFITNLY